MTAVMRGQPPEKVGAPWTGQSQRSRGSGAFSEEAAVSWEGVGKWEGNRRAVSRVEGQTLRASLAVVRPWLLL